MSTKHSRSGGKFRGSHTTVTDTAARIADIAAHIPGVTKVSPGYIKAGLPPAQGKLRVKIIRRVSHILLSVRGNTNNQELLVYSDNHQETMLALAQAIRNAGIAVAFRDDAEG